MPVVLYNKGDKQVVSFAQEHNKNSIYYRTVRSQNGKEQQCLLQKEKKEEMPGVLYQTSQ